MGGGWTVLYGNPGGDDALRFTSDVNSTSGNPLINEQYNLPLAAKRALIDETSETLFRRSTSIWLAADAPPVVGAATATEMALSGANVSMWPVKLTADSAGGYVTARGWVGSSVGNIAGGGDLGVSLGTRIGIREQSHDADLVSAQCADQLLYSWTDVQLDGDGSYAAGATLGNWGAEGSCDGAEGGGFAFSVSVRKSKTMPRTYDMPARVG